MTPSRRRLLVALGAAAVVAVGVAVAVGLHRPWVPDSAAWRAVDAQVRAAHPDVPLVGTDTLAAWLGQPDAPLLLDARTAPEYAVSHLPGAVRVDPDASAAALADTVAALRADPARPVVVYCAVGWRSAGVAERLRAAGAGDVRNLRGSIFRWASEGRPLVADGRPATRVHPFDAVWGRLLPPDLRSDGGR